MRILKRLWNSSLTEVEKAVEVPQKPQEEEDLMQDYEAWKREILENAAKAQKATAEWLQLPDCCVLQRDSVSTTSALELCLDF